MLTNYYPTILDNIWLQIEYDKKVDEVIIIREDLPILLKALLEIFGKKKVFEELAQVI